MKKIAIYGKGGIGKSTITSNLAAACAVKGFKVMVVGCDPKSDSTSNLLGGKDIKTALDTIRTKSDDVELEDIVQIGFGGVVCIESGGPPPGVGCAGRGIITAFEKLDELNAYNIYKPDIVIFDVLGDVVCGGFSLPLRQGYADEVYIVSSGEKMSLYAAENIIKAVKGFAYKNGCKLGGIIANLKYFSGEIGLIQATAEKHECNIIHTIYRNEEIQHAENENKTVIEKFKDTEFCNSYYVLAEKILNNINL